VIYQRLGYLMRSGPPDALDRLVANNFGNLAADLVLERRLGLMTAILGGTYDAVDLETVGQGVKKVDVERFYDRAQYRPKVVGVLGLPMFLH
jgi:6-phosphofructokinase 1